MNKIAYFYPKTDQSEMPLLTLPVSKDGISSMPINLEVRFIVEEQPAKYQFELKLDGNTFLEKDKSLIPLKLDKTFNSGLPNDKIIGFSGVVIRFELEKISANDSAKFEITLFNENGESLDHAETTLYFVELMEDNNAKD
ncbi:MAG TPA: hypothetical protein VGC17_02460 [Lactovum miscens]|uniref:hypothetical protein n=1 Tax=Lactovum miscens TaxID=190387 RepID=UPI002ED7E046